MTKPVESTEILPGAIVECTYDPAKWGVVVSVSDCGECVYLKPYGPWSATATGYVGLHRELIRVRG